MGNFILFLAILLAGAWFTFYTAAHQVADGPNWASGACTAARVLCHSPQLLAYGNGSGDYAIAFTTATELRSRPGDARPVPRQILPTDAVSPLFQAALEATEEAVYNALLRATTTTGYGRTLEAIPVDSVREILKRHALAR